MIVGDFWLILLCPPRLKRRKKPWYTLLPNRFYIEQKIVIHKIKIWWTMTKLWLNFTSKNIEKYDGVTTGRSLWLPLPVMYVIHVMEQTNHRQDICLPKTSFSVGIPYMYENVEETVVLHVRMYVRNGKYDNLIFLSWR